MEDKVFTETYLRDLYAAPRSCWLRLNMIHSINGSVTGADGTSNSLTNRTDRRIMNIIRDLSDVVLVGAETIRTEGLWPPARARLAILTRTGNIGHSLRRLKSTPSVPPVRPIILFPQSAASTVATNLGQNDTELVALPDSSNENASIRAVVAALHERNLTAITCEGGPHLATQLLNAQLIDELCLTTSPHVTLPVTPMFFSRHSSPPNSFHHNFSLVHLFHDDNALYARWFRKSAAQL